VGWAHEREKKQKQKNGENKKRKKVKQKKPQERTLYHTIKSARRESGIDWSK